MIPLRQAIETLRRELEDSGATAASATLQCVFTEGPQQGMNIAVLTSADTARGPVHSVTVDLGANSAHPLDAAPASVTAAVAPMTVATPSMHSLLVSMFGVPGFDNAARASVFREILEALTPTQVETLLADLRRDRTEVPLERSPDSAVAAARIRLLRLLKLGPAGLNGGIDALLQTFSDTPVETVLAYVRDTWKTQSDWIDTTPPGVRLD